MEFEPTGTAETRAARAVCTRPARAAAAANSAAKPLDKACPMRTTLERQPSR
jgi:hypothetical protein